MKTKLLLPGFALFNLRFVYMESNQGESETQEVTWEKVDKRANELITKVDNLKANPVVGMPEEISNLLKDEIKEKQVKDAQKMMEKFKVIEKVLVNVSLCLELKDRLVAAGMLRPGRWDNLKALFGSRGPQFKEVTNDNAARFIREFGAVENVHKLCRSNKESAAVNKIRTMDTPEGKKTGKAQDLARDWPMNAPFLEAELNKEINAEKAAQVKKERDSAEDILKGLKDA
jgi:hypothetical protein